MSTISTYSSRYAQEGPVFKCEQDLKQAQETLDKVSRESRTSDAYHLALGKVFACEKKLKAAKETLQTAKEKANILFPI